MDLNKIDGGRLLLQLQAKNKEAFAVLYHNYAAALFGMASRIIGSSMIAEDLLRDSFVKIWKYIDRYDAAKGTLFTWMANILRNTCFDYLRSKKRQMAISEQGLEYVNGHVADSLAGAGEDGRALRLLTQKLEPKYRELIDLVYFYGYSQDEVATMLNIPIGTVKTRCRAALKQLRHLYGIPVL